MSCTCSLAHRPVLHVVKVRRRGFTATVGRMVSVQCPFLGEERVREAVPGSGMGVEWLSAGGRGGRGYRGKGTKLGFRGVRGQAWPHLSLLPRICL